MFKKGLVYLFISIMILLFQNCLNIDSSFESSSHYKSAQLTGGGEVYDGKLRPGEYIHEVIAHGCSDITNNQRTKMWSAGVNLESIFVSN